MSGIVYLEITASEVINYSKTCFKQPLKKKTEIGFQDRLWLNADQKYYRMLLESILQYFRPSLSYHLSLRPLFCLFLTGFTVEIMLFFKKGYPCFYWVLLFVKKGWGSGVGSQSVLFSYRLDSFSCKALLLSDVKYVNFIMYTQHSTSTCK